MRINRARRRVATAMAASGAGVAMVLGLHTTKSAAIRPGTTSRVAGPATRPSGPQPTTPPSTAGASTAPRSANGTPENYGYGTMTVSVTIDGQHIAQVSVAHLQTIDPYSQSLAQQVIPMLKQEVLNAQSANIQGVSGATYTSEAYAYSLQAALNHLGFR